MKKKNVQRIRLTAIYADYQGMMLDRYMSETLLLRTARRVGDEENVNHYVLGLLNEHKRIGMIDFIKVEQ